MNRLKLSIQSTKASLGQISLASLGIILIACSGGGGGGSSTLPSTTPSPTPAPAPAPSPAPVTLNCPTGYILVPGESGLSTADFCVSVYEMRNSSGSPASTSAGTPWVNVSRTTALAACQSLGSNYDLISNSQWQTLARNIASVGANWSSGTVGHGYMNIGNADYGGATVCDSTQEYVDMSCGVRAPTGNFIFKRTHTLSSGDVLWDMGGNLYEVMKDLSTAGQYPGGCAADLTAANPASDALGTEKNAFGLATVAGFSLDTVSFGCAGMGGLLGSSNNTATNRAVLRGGSFYDQTGIFNADIGWAQASDSDGSYSFRCVYQ